MNTLVQISLPAEQVERINYVSEKLDKLLGHLNKSVWLNREEAAERLKISETQLDRWVKEGWLRHCKKGNGCIRFKSDHLDQDFEEFWLVKSKTNLRRFK